MGLNAQEDVGSVKLGERVGWVGFQREYCIVYKTGLRKLSVTFLLGRIGFILRGPLCSLCFCVCAHFFGVFNTFQGFHSYKKTRQI